MAHAFVALLFFLSQPFWEAKPPEQWTDQEIGVLRGNSPWAQEVGQDPPVLVYLATAAPIEAAERELRRRSARPAVESDPDYADFLRTNRQKVFVLAIPWAQPSRFGTAAEQKKMVEESVMIIGRKKYPLAGHFPPSPADPVLRLIFPRELRPADKAMVIQLYLPGVTFPEREAEFRTKELMYQGKLEM
jgi:hypothetical protein